MLTRFLLRERATTEHVKARNLSAVLMLRFVIPTKVSEGEGRNPRVEVKQ